MISFKLLAVPLAFSLLTGCHSKHENASPIQKQVGTEQVLRAHRLELTDDGGKVRAIVGFRSGASEPEVTLLDGHGKEAAMLKIDKRGQATMYFSDPNVPIDGRVAVGYLWGSDCCYEPGEYDPLGSWGMRILKKNAAGYLSFHELVLADPNEHDPKKFASPVKVLPSREAPNAHR